MTAVSNERVLEFVQRNLAHEIINTAYHESNHDVPKPGVPERGILEELPRETLKALSERYPRLMKAIDTSEGLGGRELSAALGERVAKLLETLSKGGKVSEADIRRLPDPRARNLLWTAYQYAKNGKPDVTSFDAVVQQRREAAAVPESICVPDERQPSNDRFVGRASSQAGRAGCSITMIGDDVALSAGHCIGSLRVAEFNVPASTPNGDTRAAAPEHRYEIDRDSIVGVGAGVGDDWVVFRTKPNPLTGLHAGVAQARGEKYYVPRFEAPAVGSPTQITGYGRAQRERNFAQQSHTGRMLQVGGSRLAYNADTEPGNSGSSVRVGDDFRDIIGIHTHGGCSFGGNQGTWLGHAPLRAAIEAALGEQEAGRRRAS